MMQNNQSEQPTQTYIHPIVWFTVCVLFMFLVGFTVIANWSHANDIAKWTWIVIFILLGVWLFHTLLKMIKLHHDHVHDVMIKHDQRTLSTLKVQREQEKVRQEQAKTAAIEMLPSMIRYAMDSGYNVKFSGLEATNYLSSLSSLHNAPAAVLPPTLDRVPEPHRFSDILQGWTPTKDGILLGTGSDRITVPVGEALCHTALGGRTDSGKSNIELLLMAQLLFLGEIVYICNPHYRRIWQDRNGEVYDLSNMEPHFAYPPITDPDILLALINHLRSKLDERKAIARTQLVTFPPIYLFMDELPAWAYYIPEIMDILGIFLRESRKYGIFFIGAAQDFLNDTLQSDNGAVRDNFLTNYFGGGDDTTARVLLDLMKGEKLDQTGLGKMGLFYLLAKSVADSRYRVRVPLVDTRSINMLFEGRAVSVSGGDFVPENYRQKPETRNKSERVAELKSAGLKDTEILRELWGVNPGGGPAYQRARAEYYEIVNAMPPEEYSSALQEESYTEASSDSTER